MKFEDRKTKRVPMPPTLEEVSEFQAWREKYEALEDEGLSRNWLESTYEDGNIITGPQPSGYEIREETDEEYQERTQGPLAGANRVMHDMAEAHLASVTRWADKILNEMPEGNRNPDGSYTFKVSGK